MVLKEKHGYNHLVYVSNHVTTYNVVGGFVERRTHKEVLVVTQRVCDFSQAKRGPRSLLRPARANFVICDFRCGATTFFEEEIVQEISILSPEHGTCRMHGIRKSSREHEPEFIQIPALKWSTSRSLAGIFSSVRLLVLQLQERGG